MPELPEVETVKETLKRQVVGKVIEDVFVYHSNTIVEPLVSLFMRQLKGQTILDITRRGKWLVFHLTDYCLLSHLRMEGKYFIRGKEEERMLHELVKFDFTDGSSLRYHDTRKFGKMYLVLKEKVNDSKPFLELGPEPWSEMLTTSYLKGKYSKKKIPIKTALLDQGIITGIGNIYADEILFLSKISPLRPCSDLTKGELENIIYFTREVLEKAILKGGTTIRSYTSSEGVHGLFQTELLVHSKEGEACPVCGTKIIKTKIGGRGTYYCSKCQKG